MVWTGRSNVARDVIASKYLELKELHTAALKSNKLYQDRLTCSLTDRQEERAAAERRQALLEEKLQKANQRVRDVEIQLQEMDAIQASRDNALRKVEVAEAEVRGWRGLLKVINEGLGTNFRFSDRDDDGFAKRLKVINPMNELASVRGAYQDTAPPRTGARDRECLCEG